MKKSYKGKRIIAFLLAMLLLVQVGDEYTSVSLAQNKSSNIEEPIAEPITKSETEETIESEQETVRQQHRKKGCSLNMHRCMSRTTT